MYRLIRIIFDNPQIIIPAVILFSIFHLYKELKQDKVSQAQIKDEEVKEEKFESRPRSKTKLIPINEKLTPANPQRSIANAKDVEPIEDFKSVSTTSEEKSAAIGMVSNADNVEEESIDEDGERRQKNHPDEEDELASTFVANPTASTASTNQSGQAATTTPAAMVFGNTGFYNPPSTPGTSSGTSGPTTGSTSSSSGSSSSSSTTCTLAPSPAAGEYVTNPSISFSGTCTDIYYAVNSGSCLDPIEFGTNFNGTSVAVGASNGEYCVSYYGSKNGKTSTVQYATYTIDDADIPLIFAPTVIPRRVQTNQVYKMNAHSSTEFGKTGYEFFAYNIGNINPATLTTNCKQLAESSGYNLNTHGMRSPAGNLSESTASLEQTDSIFIPLSFQNGLNYGDNTIVSFMQFTDSNNQVKYGCLANQVELFDFSVGQIFLNSHHQTPATTHGAHVFQGGIKSFGHFNAGAIKGSGTGKVGNNMIQTDFINITN